MIAYDSLTLNAPPFLSLHTEVNPAILRKNPIDMYIITIFYVHQQNATISQVVPAICTLYRKMQLYKGKTLAKMAKSLKDSLWLRFRGIFNHFDDLNPIDEGVSCTWYQLRILYRQKAHVQKYTYTYADTVL